MLPKSLKYVSNTQIHLQIKLTYTNYLIAIHLSLFYIIVQLCTIHQFALIQIDNLLWNKAIYNVNRERRFKTKVILCNLCKFIFSFYKKTVQS